MGEADEKWQEALEQLRKGFVERLPSKLGDLQKSWKALEEGWSADGFGDFLRLAHGIAGTCATYGFMEVSQKARQLESFLREMREQGDPSVPADSNKKDVIIRFLHDLEASISGTTADQPH